jgi:hypothetical protein
MRGEPDYARKGMPSETRLSALGFRLSELLVLEICD